MSNPAVIVLAEDEGAKRFVIEDNIGESIHIHLNNLRLDFTLIEFLEFSRLIRNSLDRLDLLKGLNVSTFDESFLRNCSTILPFLKEIRIEKIKLKELVCIEHVNLFNNTYQKRKEIFKTKAFQYLNKRSNNFLKYEQYNYINTTNQTRLESLLDSINENGYPHLENYIILFEGQQIIRDGQHRAVILYHLFGPEHEIDVQRFYFYGQKHKLKIYKSNLYKFLKTVMLNSISKIKFLIKFLLRK